jgi:hypothetical protein
MKRLKYQYENVKPEAIVNGSDAQCHYFVQDAKADILELIRFVEKVARLNGDAGEIGPGMLKTLVDEARELVR